MVITTIVNKMEPFNNEKYIQAQWLKATAAVLNNPEIKTKGPEEVLSYICKYFDALKKEIQLNGQQIHAFIENAIKLKQFSIDTNALKGEVLQGIEAWNSFVKEHQIEFYASEVILTSKKYEGRLDLIASVDGEIMILDIKSTNFVEDKVFIPKGHLLQLSMYFDCLVDMYDENYDFVLENQFILDKNKTMNMLIRDLVEAPCVGVLYLCKNTGKYYLVKFKKEEIETSLKQIELWQQSNDLTIAKSRKLNTYRSIYDN